MNTGRQKPSDGHGLYRQYESVSQNDDGQSLYDLFFIQK